MKIDSAIIVHYHIHADQPLWDKDEKYRIIRYCNSATNNKPISSLESLGLLRLKTPFTRSDFKNPILGSENRTQAFRRSDFKIPFCWCLSSFKRSVGFFKIKDPCVGTSFLLCSDDPIFGTNKNRTVWTGFKDSTARSDSHSYLQHLGFDWPKDI